MQEICRMSIGWGLLSGVFNHEEIYHPDKLYIKKLVIYFSMGYSSFYSQRDRWKKDEDLSQIMLSVLLKGSEPAVRCSFLSSNKHEFYYLLHIDDVLNTRLLSDIIHFPMSILEYVNVWSAVKGILRHFKVSSLLLTSGFARRSTHIQSSDLGFF